MQLLSEKDMEVIKPMEKTFLEKNEIDTPKIDGSQGGDPFSENITSETLIESFYQPQTEGQLLRRIDSSIEHCKQGLSRDGHEVVAELRSEFKLAS